jgi:hypothetical protein
MFWISSIYLAIPVLIFLVGWLKFYWALPLAIGVILSLVQLRASLKDSPLPAVRSSRFGALFLLALLWTLISGVAGLGTPMGDWEKHHAVLWDLITRPWPVTYVVHEPSEIPRAGLVYYLGYYMPAAVIGKVAGWYAANVALFFQSLIGVFLCLLLVDRNLRLSGRKAWLLGLFPLFSGMHAIGFYYQRGALWDGVNTFTGWSNFGSFLGNSSSFFFSPQHSITAWLIGGVFLEKFHGWSDRATPKVNAGFVVFFLSLTAFWAPFASIGGAVIFALALWGRKSLGKWEKIPFLTGALLGLLWLAYYATKTYPLATRFLWNAEFLRAEGMSYLVFIVIEFGVLVSLLFHDTPKRKKSQRINLLAIAVALSFCPALWMGFCGDFGMRVSQPLLYWLWLWGLHQAVVTKDGFTRRALILLFAIGAWGQVCEIYRASRWWKYQHMPAETAMKSLEEKQSDPIYRAYIGNRDDFFFRYLARESESRTLSQNKSSSF